MKLSACIVVYNGYDEALKAAQTVLHCTRRYPVTLYLVDNASPDGSGKKLEQAVADGLLVAWACAWTGVSLGLWGCLAAALALGIARLPLARWKWARGMPPALLPR